MPSAIGMISGMGSVTRPSLRSKLSSSSLQLKSMANLSFARARSSKSSPRTEEDFVYENWQNAEMEKETPTWYVPESEEPLQQRQLNVFNNALESGGYTPVVKMERLMDPWRKAGINAELYLKMEDKNPGWSVKFRPGMNMLVDAEERGILDPSRPQDFTVIESSSGNTAIALSVVCAIKGYKFIAVVDAKMPESKAAMIKVHGGIVDMVGTPGDGSSANELKTQRRQRVIDLQAEVENSFVPNQYSNPANPDAHVRTTGVEFMQQVPGVDLVVLGTSTGGQLRGIGGIMKACMPNLEVLGVEPVGSTIFGGEAGNYANVGTGLDYTPVHAEFMLDNDLLDHFKKIEDKDAIASVRAIAASEGVFPGVSTGQNIFAALSHLEDVPAALTSNPDKPYRMGVIMCDDGRAYLDIIMDGSEEGAVHSAEALYDRVKGEEREAAPSEFERKNVFIKGRDSL